MTPAGFRRCADRGAREPSTANDEAGVAVVIYSRQTGAR